MAMKPEYEEPFREYAWNYFELHADQRLKAFQFYIVLSAVIVGGFFTILKAGGNHKWISVLGFLWGFLSFVFWKMDQRIRQLVKNAEAALKFLDDQYRLPNMDGAPHLLRLFSRDDFITGAAPRWPLIYGYFSYSRVFEWVFFIFGVVGAAGGLICLILLPA